MSDRAVGIHTVKLPAQAHLTMQVKRLSLTNTENVLLFTLDVF